MKRVCIFGGSFDPIHSGHLIIAERALQQFSLDRMIFMPARRSPHKPTASYAPGSHRLTMIRAAIKGHARFTWDDGELRRKGLSFTIDTLERMHAEDPGIRLYLLVGSDNIRSFRFWREPTRIAQLAQILVYKRWEHDVTPRMLARWSAKLLKGPEIFLSSTAIRNRCASGKTIRYFVPRNVERYIDRHGLYARSGSRDEDAGIQG